MDDVYAYYVWLPGKVKGATVRKDGDYIVFINEALSEDERNNVLKHELKHVRYNHLYNDCIAVCLCEREAVTSTQKIKGILYENQKQETPRERTV